MNSKKFSEAMNEVDNKYVNEALHYKKKASKYIWVKWGAVAVCLVIMCCAGARLLSPEMPAEDISDLPMLSITENSADGMGFEGYMAYDISELMNANPWNEALELSALPVFKNRLTYDENFLASEVDFDKMRKFLLDIADRLGFDSSELAVTEGNDPYDQRLRIDTDEIKMEVDAAMTVKITFDPPISLPGEYNFANFAPYEDIAAVAEYLKAEYKDLIGIDTPQINIYGGDYTFYLDQSYEIEFYDAGGDDIRRIINYNFNKVAFHGSDEGLWLAKVFQPDLSNKVGDYPIITSAQAAELLTAGNYITTVPYEMPGSEYIKKVELIYRTGELETYYMPYYRFYVELPEEERENGLKMYGAYYVPAVEGTYITNMPVWDGRFN